MAEIILHKILNFKIEFLTKINETGVNAFFIFYISSNLL